MIAPPVGGTLPREAFTELVGDRIEAAPQEAAAAGGFSRVLSRSVKEGRVADRVRSHRIMLCRGEQRHVTFPVLRDGEPGGALRHVTGPPGAGSAAVLAVLGAGTDPWQAAGKDR